MILGNTAPHPEKVPYPIIRPRVHLQVTFTCLSRSIFGVDTHWGNGSTYVCVGPDECHACKKGQRPRYQGYVMGRGHSSGVVGIIHLTASAAGSIYELDCGERGLVGLKLSIERSGEKDNSEVEAHFLGWDASTEEFPHETFTKLMLAVFRVNKPAVSKIRGLEFPS
jgi:hypothetical protein